ncbi:heterokaryon incompatibility, partial [Clohesyomyces aquaticus]
TYKTETHSLGARLKGFAWEDIPPTFQDAISTCRSLNFRFLWIDSLCIIQDDIDGWAEESSRMSGIYSNAALTIAAAAAKDDIEKFLNSRSSECKSFPVITGNFRTEIMTRRVLHGPRETTKPGPPIRRGWVLQERF